MKCKFVILMFLLIFISMASVAAGDANQTDSDFSRLDSECCSFVIQEENETVLAFRQDAPLNGFGVEVHEDSWNDTEIIREEIDTTGEYFTHAVVAENGWVFSNGGSQYGQDNLDVEDAAKKMIYSNNISYEGLADVQKVLKKYEYGHFLIKAPDGRYGVAYYNICFLGTLRPGEYLTVPNIYDFFRYGNYSDYSTNPVDAIIEICSYDDSGWNRRNLYVYDCKAFDTDNGQKYGIDFYVSNDNGHNAGLNVSHIVTYFYYNGDFYPASIVPEMPNKLYVATHIFENQTLDSVFEVFSPENVIVGNDTSVSYRINNLVDEKTVVFELDDKIDFINAVVSNGDYHYDSNLNTLYWNLSASNISKSIILNFRPKAKGNYTIRAYVEDMDEECEVTAYATDFGTVLRAENVTTYKTYYKSMKIYLTDDEGIPLIGEKVSIEINGTVYSREVTPRGYAALAIMMQPGEYDALITYDGPFGPSQCTSKIIVNKTLFTSDLEFFYGEVQQYNVSCLDHEGNFLKNFEVDFSLDGVLKDRYANDEGIASLPIMGLKPGNHTIISYNLETNEYVGNVISVRSISAEDIVKVFRNGTQYFATFVDGEGTALANASVSISVNGINYTRMTDGNGTAKLNINLGEGTYDITATNPATGETKTNSIRVIGLLESSNLVKYYKNASQFVVRVLTPDGSYAGAGEEVIFNINGVFYTRTTNATGHAKLNINLYPGNYTITSYYNGSVKGNSIEVLPVLSASDLNMKYGDGSVFEARLLDGEGNPYAGETITFNINGVFYNRTTDASGIAKLNINLMKGEYIITSSYNGADVANKITVS